MATTSAGHAQQYGTDPHTLNDNYHPFTRAQQAQSVVNYNSGHPNDDELKTCYNNGHPNDDELKTCYNNGHPNDDEPKIKDILYLFNKNNNGQKNLWGLVLEEEEMRNVKKKSNFTPTPAAASENKRPQQARRRRRQRASKLFQNQHEIEFPTFCKARPQTLFDGKFRGGRLGSRDLAMPILIKGIEFTGVAVPELQRSCISSEVAEGLGICVHTVCCYYGEALIGEYVQQTLHSIPAYLGSSKQCRVSSEFDVVDMEYYDVYLGADLLPVYLKEHPNYVL